MVCKFNVDKTMKAYKQRLDKHMFEDMIKVSEEMYGKDSAITVKIREFVDDKRVAQSLERGDYNGVHTALYARLYNIQHNIENHEAAHDFFHIEKTELKEGPL